MDSALLLPSDEDVASYRRHGWWVSDVIVPDHALDAAVTGSDAYYRGEMGAGPPIPEQCAPRPPFDAGMRKHDYASLRRSELATLVRVEAIAAIAARLAGASGVRLWHDQLLYKPSSANATAPANVGWHTDRSYWGACTSEEMVTAWVPFHDVTVAHGPLTVLDGSHLWRTDSGDDRRFHRQDLDVMEGEIASGPGAGRQLVKVPLTMRRGQVSFHHCRTFHGSGPNTSGEPRRSLAIHLQPLDNRHTGERDGEGRLTWHQNNELCRQTADGLPDYTDERYFPQLWPVTGSAS